MIFLDFRTKKMDIEIATCTDVRQKWGKLKKDGQALYEVVPVKEFCHGKPKASVCKIPKITDEDYEFFFKRAAELCPDSEFAKMKRQCRSNPLPALETSAISKEYCVEILSSPIRPPLQDQSKLFALRSNGGLQEITLLHLPDPLRQFYKNKVEVTIDQALKIATDPAAGQGTKEWFEQRCLRITASKARQLVTYATNRSPDWTSKVSGYYSDKFKGSWQTAHGTRAEPRARQCYERTSQNKVVQCGLMINPNVPWIACSHDGIVEYLKTVELKSPVAGKTLTADEVVVDLAYINMDSGSPELKVAHDYHCQVQLGMFIANLKECDFVTYSTFDDTCTIINVKYNEDLVLNEYLPKLQYVYFSHCLKYIAENYKEITEKN